MYFTSFLYYCCSSLILLISGFVPAAVTSIGINYGQIADNLPQPEQVVALVRSIGVKKVKLYDADPKVLRAFANTGVEFIVSLGNEYLSDMKDPMKAQAWVKENVQTHLPATNITCITIGNEVLTLNDTHMSGALLPAMQGVQTALSKLGLDKQIFVTTAHSLAILESSYPPSSGSFCRDLMVYLCPILSFLAKNNRSPFLINAYPYFAYKANPKQVPLDYVLFQPNHGTFDSSTKLRYDNMLFAQIDAVYAALASVDYGQLPVQISETGWPSKGDDNEAGATPENAMKYNGNLIKITALKNGTPMKPKSDLNIYVFALFNENLKPGPASERNYGLFKPDATPAYSLPFAGITTAASGNISTGGPSSVSSPPHQRLPTPMSPAGSSSGGYLSISLATDRYYSVGLVVLSCLSWITLIF